MSFLRLRSVVNMFSSPANTMFCFNKNYVRHKWAQHAHCSEDRSSLTLKQTLHSNKWRFVMEQLWRWFAPPIHHPTSMVTMEYCEQAIEPDQYSQTSSPMAAFPPCAFILIFGRKDRTHIIQILDVDLRNRRQHLENNHDSVTRLFILKHGYYFFKHVRTWTYSSKCATWQTIWHLSLRNLITNQLAIDHFAMLVDCCHMFVSIEILLVNVMGKRHLWSWHF